MLDEFVFSVSPENREASEIPMNSQPPSLRPAPVGQAVLDEYGRDVSRWIEVEGKLKPHP